MTNEYLKHDKDVHQDLSSDALLIYDGSKIMKQGGQEISHSKSKKYFKGDDCSYC